MMTWLKIVCAKYKFPHGTKFDDKEKDSTAFDVLHTDGPAVAALMDSFSFKPGFGTLAEVASAELVAKCLMYDDCCPCLGQVLPLNTQLTSLPLQ
jgi:hypothetical protein